MDAFRLYLNQTFYNNSIFQYLTAACTLVGLILVLMLTKRLVLSRLGKWVARSAGDRDDFFVGLIAKIGPVTIAVVSLYFATMPLQLQPKLRAALFNILVIVLTVRSVLTLQEIIRFIIRQALRRTRPSDPTAESVGENITSVVRWALWALASVFVLDNMGINISTLLAGVGIGGIAVAIASQAVLGDLFSALSILVDKPFELGDFIIVENFMGTVEYVGLKTTRLRSLDGEQLILSNSDLTKSRIRNYKRMKTRRVVFKIGVVHETPIEKLKRIPEMIKNILNNSPDVRMDRVHFSSLGDFSLVYEIVYYVLSADYNLYMDRQQEINLSLKEMFEQEGIEWACNPLNLVR